MEISSKYEWLKWLSYYVNFSSYLIVAHTVSGHDEGYDELASALERVQVVAVGAVTYQSFVCSTPASENVSDLHVMGFRCDDISVPLLLPKAEYNMVITYSSALQYIKLQKMKFKADLKKGPTVSYATFEINICTFLS